MLDRLGKAQAALILSWQRVSQRERRRAELSIFLTEAGEPHSRQSHSQAPGQPWLSVKPIVLC